MQNSVRRSLQGTRSAEWPNLIGDPVPADQTLEHWINRDAFAIPALGTFGDAGVGILRAPGYFNADLSISKRFATFGRQYLQFRGEMFNALNHPNFGPPNRDIQSTTFGTVTSTAARRAHRAAGPEVLLLGGGTKRGGPVTYAALHGYST